MRYGIPIYVPDVSAVTVIPRGTLVWTLNRAASSDGGKLYVVPMHPDFIDAMTWFAEEGDAALVGGLLIATMPFAVSVDGECPSAPLTPNAMASARFSKMLPLSYESEPAEYSGWTSDQQKHWDSLTSALTALGIVNSYSVVVLPVFSQPSGRPPLVRSSPTLPMEEDDTLYAVSQLRTDGDHGYENTGVTHLVFRPHGVYVPVDSIGTLVTRSGGELEFALRPSTLEVRLDHPYVGDLWPGRMYMVDITA